VINISWDEAKAYARWLAFATGNSYRLPTEAEWEYAARSGGKNELWAGTSEENRLPEYAVHGKYSKGSPHPVGSRKPNGLGLHDMSGNVWEWVEDCSHDSYHSAPTDGSAWLEANGGDCRKRIVRGGSWLYKQFDLRSSSRQAEKDEYRYLDLGFRLAQDID
jgi:formylglycine-generating enzyme required for sulfatase activity